ncbi:very short patch repair endonuclease [soil metagenome]
MPLPYPVPTSASISQVMRGNRKVDTSPEVRLRSALHRAGLRFRKARMIEVDGLRVRPDVVFPRQRVAIFVDGCFWHSCPQHGTWPRTNSAYWIPKLQRNVERDHLVNAALTAGGWSVVRVWEHEVTIEVDATLERVQRAVGGARGGGVAPLRLPLSAVTSS